MNEQINLRLPEKLLMEAGSYAEKYGYGTVQELIKESLREKLFGEKMISKKEWLLVQKLVEATEKNNLFGTEEELFKILRRS